MRAGTGGDEAAIFAGDLFRMYARYAETHGFTVEILSESPGEHGGYREIISRIAGPGAFARFKFESGVHRVQRVPATEAQGRIHTSAVHRRHPARARRSRGHGSESRRAARRHLPRLGRRRPARQQDRLGHPHHAPAHRPRGRVPGRTLAAQEPLARDGADEGQAARRRAARSATARSRANRKLQVGTGDRSERIRTYNFPQGRVTDHRINLTLYKLGDIMQGKIDELLDALQHEHQAEQLAEEEQRGAA